MYPTGPARWYKTAWGIMLLGFGALVVVLAGTFAFLTAKYWWQIKHGTVSNPPALTALGAGFTAIPGAANSVTSVDRTQLETADSPYLGRPSAPTVIVEFVDYKCPNCLTAAPIMRQLLTQYGFKIKFITRHFPAESLHPGTTQLANIVQCGYEQGMDKYWPLSDWLFQNQTALPNGNLDADGIKQLALYNNLDVTKLNTCLTNPASNEKVSRDYFDGLRFGVRGTPTFFINGEKVEGVVPLERWKSYLDKT